MNLSLLRCLFFATFTVTCAIHAAPYTPVGWYWYNEPVIEKSIKPQSAQVPMSPTQQMNVLRAGLKESLDQAILYPTPQNVKTYLELQKFMGDQSGRFAAMYTPVLLTNPSLDYNVNHPTATIASEMLSNDKSQNEAQAISSLAKTHGIFFFYRGKNQLDELMAKITARFAAQYHIAIIAISMDGVISPFFKDSKVNQGQAAHLGVKAYPAIFLVDPNSNTPAQPVSYGFLSIDDLASRFLAIAQQFKPEY